jgi:hypothetical protein
MESSTRILTLYTVLTEDVTTGTDHRVRAFPANFNRVDEEIFSNIFTIIITGPCAENSYLAD